MLLLIVPMIGLSQFIAYWRTDVVDDQMFGYFGWRIADGATVYVDVWDNKPPGIYWINAVGMLVGGGSYFGVIAMCVVALVAAHTCFFCIGASLYYRGAATFATVLLCFYLTHGYYTGGTNRTETFLVACELGAVLFYMRGWARDRWWKWYAAGILCGVRVSVQTGGTGRLGRDGAAYDHPGPDARSGVKGRAAALSCYCWAAYARCWRPLASTWPRRAHCGRRGSPRSNSTGPISPQERASSPTAISRTTCSKSTFSRSCCCRC